MLDYCPARTVTSDTRTVTIVQARVTKTKMHYNGRTADYDAWGLHLFGDGLAAGEATAEWTNATPFEGTDAFGVYAPDWHRRRHQAVGFIVHGRPPATTRTSRTRTRDRFFVPLATPEIWLRQGDARIFTCAAGIDSCVVPSAN